MRVLVTGASGFVGRSLVGYLAEHGYTVRAAVRRPTDIFPKQVEVAAVSDLEREVEWDSLLRDVNAIVHLAGIAHAAPDIAEDVYDRVNHLVTARLAAAAVDARIKRLIFISSIRAQAGPSSAHVLTEADLPQPTDAYGRSKLAAEMSLRASGVPFAILRPVLIYGPGVKGNLASLLRLTQSSWPLPFGAFTNRRSLLARENLSAAIHFLLGASEIGCATYVVADPTPVTLAGIVSALRLGQGRRSGPVPISPLLIKGFLKAAGMKDLWDRLGGESVVDPSKLLAAGWQPVVDTRRGLAAMAQAASPGGLQRFRWRGLDYR